MKVRNIISVVLAIAAVSASWNNHPLIIRLLVAIYEYLEEKAKEAAHELPQKP